MEWFVLFWFLLPRQRGQLKQLNLQLDDQHDQHFMIPFFLVKNPDNLATASGDEPVYEKVVSVSVKPTASSEAKKEKDVAADSAVECDADNVNFELVTGFVKVHRRCRLRKKKSVLTHMQSNSTERFRSNTVRLLASLPEILNRKYFSSKFLGFCFAEWLKTDNCLWTLEYWLKDQLIVFDLKIADFSLFASFACATSKI